MTKATNSQTSKVIAPLSGAAYLEILPLDVERESFLLKNPTGEQIVNVVIGGSTPTDNTRAFTMEVGSSIDTFTAPMGPVWVRSASATVVSNMEMLAD